jgi:hypothetical protein
MGNINTTELSNTTHVLAWCKTVCVLGDTSERHRPHHNQRAEELVHSCCNARQQITPYYQLISRAQHSAASLLRHSATSGCINAQQLWVARHAACGY